MNILIIAPEARIDLDRIWSFIASDNIHTADKVVSSVYKTGNQLCLFPHLGKLHRGKTTNFHYISTKYHWILYRITPNSIEISRVFSHREDWQHLI